MRDRPTVVATGIGVLCGPATGAEPFWALLTTSPPDRATCREVEGFEPRRWLDRQRAQRADPFAQLAAAAGLLAKQDAGIDVVDRARTGVVMGTALGPLSSILAEHARFQDGGAKAVSALMPVRTLPNGNAAVLGSLLEIDGPCYSVAAGCASGSFAVGEAARLIERGACDVAFAGASEAGMDDGDRGALAFLEAGLGHLRVISDQPTGRPFDVDRRGFIPAEGAAVIVLESLEHATARGARIYAEVAGSALALDGDLVAPAADGVAITTAIDRALADADVAPEEVRHVNAHGSGTPANDVAEANGIHRALGRPGPAVVSVKGLTGHSGAGAGAVEAAALLLSLHHELLPATHGLQQPDESLGLNVVAGTPRPWEPGPALSLSLGLGGHVACLVARPAPG